MAEWFKALVLKTNVAAMLPKVRILLPPPKYMPKKPAAKESISELKKQLQQLQGKVAEYEVSVAEAAAPAVQAVQAATFAVKTLYSWKAPERIFIRRNRKWYSYLFLLLLIIILVLLFLKQFIIIAPIAALGFVAYVMASVPPHHITHKLTNEGVTTENKSYLWTELYDFWLVTKGGQKMIELDTYLNYPRRLVLLVGEGELEKIKEVMLQYIPFREIPRETFMDKAANFLSERFHKIAS